MFIISCFEGNDAQREARNKDVVKFEKSLQAGKVLKCSEGWGSRDLDSQLSVHLSLDTSRRRKFLFM